MSNPTLDLFAEDYAHEQFLTALIRRLTQESELDITIQVRVARGGHGRTMTELVNYRRLIDKAITPAPDVVVVAIDANCQGFNQVRREIERFVTGLLQDRLVIACPDPHIERWYLADPVSFYQVIGNQPKLERMKCERGRYKRLLLNAIREAGHIPTLGGVEFAQELVDAMDLYRVGKNDPALGIFITDMQKMIQRLLAYTGE